MREGYPPSKTAVVHSGNSVLAKKIIKHLRSSFEF